MTPDAFITKWKASTLKERSAAQEFFVELCHLLGEPTPSSDPTGAAYCFERGALKTTGAKGWADVWKRGHFAWENKGKGADLQAAFAQLQKYAIALENPPLLVVCDLDRFRIHTNWTNTVSVVHELSLDDLREPATRQKLKAVFSDPERLRPGLTRQALTEHAASDFAKLAQRLRDRGHAPEAVAHFVQRLVFSMFAEDVGLLPEHLFSQMLLAAKGMPGRFEAMASELFGAMRSGTTAAWRKIEWFNGSLFDDPLRRPARGEVGGHGGQHHAERPESPRGQARVQADGPGPMSPCLGGPSRQPPGPRRRRRGPERGTASTERTATAASTPSAGRSLRPSPRIARRASRRSA